MPRLRNTIFASSLIAGSLLGASCGGSDAEKASGPEARMKFELPRSGEPIKLPAGVIGLSYSTRDGFVEVYATPPDNPRDIKVVNLGNFGTQKEWDQIDDIVEASIKRAAKSSDPEGQYVPLDSINIDDSNILFADGAPAEKCNVSARSGDQEGYGVPIDKDCRRIAEIIFRDLSENPIELPPAPLANDGVA